MTATRAQRRRKPIELTLSPKAREILERLAAAHPDRTRSAVVEDLLADAASRRPRE